MEVQRQTAMNAMNLAACEVVMDDAVLHEVLTREWSFESQGDVSTDHYLSRFVLAKPIDDNMSLRL